MSHLLHSLFPVPREAFNTFLIMLVFFAFLLLFFFALSGFGRAPLFSF